MWAARRLSRCDWSGHHLSTNLKFDYMPIIGHNQYCNNNITKSFHNGTIEIKCCNCEYSSSSLYTYANCKIADVINPLNNEDNERKGEEKIYANNMT